MSKLLASLKEYKDYNNISSPNKDEQIGILLEASSVYIKNYCGMSFVDYYTENKVEYANGTMKTIFLTEIPVLEVASVKTSVDGGVTKVTLTENTDYFVDSDAGAVISANTQFVSPTHEFRSLEVTYKGGYIKAPSDIILATIELCEYYKDEEFTPRKSMLSGSIENAITLSTKIPTHIKNILDSYRVL